MNSTPARLFVAVCLLFAYIPAFASGDWVEESNRNTLLVMEAQARLSPEAFSSLGIESVDSEVMDLGPDLYERTQAALQATDHGAGRT